jgi:hypothetical protein
VLSNRNTIAEQILMNLVETILCPGSALGNQPSAKVAFFSWCLCAYCILEVKTPCCFRFLTFPTQIPDKIFSKRLKTLLDTFWVCTRNYQTCIAYMSETDTSPFLKYLGFIVLNSFLSKFIFKLSLCSSCPPSWAQAQWLPSVFPVILVFSTTTDW